MTLSVGTVKLAEVLRQSGQMAASKALQEFDESGTANSLSAVVTRLVPGGRMSVGPPRDSTNLRAAEALRHFGLSDDILIRAFDRENGCLYSSNGQPVFFGRSKEGVPVFFANVDSQGRLLPLENPDSSWGVYLPGASADSNTVRIFDNPIIMLADAKQEDISRFVLTDNPSACLANLLRLHPELTQVELAIEPERVPLIEQELSKEGFVPRASEAEMPGKIMVLGKAGTVEKAEALEKAETLEKSEAMERTEFVEKSETMERVSYESEIPLLKPSLELLPDGRKAVVCGEPRTVAKVLDYRQGRNELGFQGTCGIVSSRNTLRLFGICTTEDELVHYAASKGLCVIDTRPYLSGATNATYRDRLMREWGLPGKIIKSSTVARAAEEFEKGHGVMAGVNAGILWNNPNCYGNGFSNHVVSLIGTERDEAGNLTGVYICDSGRNRLGDAARYVPIDLWQEALEVPGSSLNVTLRSRKREE